MVGVVGGGTDGDPDRRQGPQLGRLNVDTSGRSHLVSGGAELFAERPLWGYGSGSFQQAYTNHLPKEKAPVTISHTEPITVAAEQGLIGLVVYVALIVVALWTMGAGLWARGPTASRPVNDIARAAVLAAFVALLVHTMAYAGFFQDPITWVLLAIGASLAPPSPRAAAPRRTESGGHGPRPRLGSRMSGYLRRLATTGAAYTAASILSKLIAVALLPLYTRHLSLGAYGTAELLFAAVVSASIVVRLGPDRGGPALLLPRGRGSRPGRRRHLLRPLLVSTIVALVALPFARPLAEALLTLPPPSSTTARNWCGSRSAASGWRRCSNTCSPSTGSTSAPAPTSSPRSPT